MVKLFVLVISILLIYYTNANIGNESFGVIQPLIFSIGLAVAIYVPEKRPVIILIAILMWFVMIGFYLAKVADFANFFGSVGFGLVFLVILTYIPEIINKGFIADFQKWLQD